MAAPLCKVCGKRPRAKAECTYCVESYAKIKLKNHEWYVKNIDRAKANNKRWSDQNTSRRRITNQKWYLNNLDRHKAIGAGWRAKNPNIVKNNTRKHQLKKYGITEDDYRSMFDNQSGKCKICNSSDTGNKSGNFDVDHCHDTNRVRGLLCKKCNTGIGLLKHSVNVLSSAISYLENHASY